jgi:hypothetical protein
MKNILILISLTIFSYLNLYAAENKYSFRKYSHVKTFYGNVISDAMEVCETYKLPPAAVLAVAGLESGYGRGYVSQITGNILSLGAFKGDKELPMLYLPYSQSKNKVMFDSKKIKLHKKNDLTWKIRPKSYKRDYRPFPHAGTKNNLELLTYNNNLKKKARKKCLNDFATRWLVSTSNIAAFANTRRWLDKLISENGTDILFDFKVNEEFIRRIGGHPNSFNYRREWPKKANLIMKKAGLVNLVKDIHYKKINFNEAWKNK